MVTPHFRVAVTAVLLMMSAALVYPATRAQSASGVDSAAIKQVAGKIEAAWDHHDPVAWAALFTEDADSTNLRGVAVHGRKNIEAFLTNLFNGVLKNSTFSGTVRSVRMLSPTLAVLDLDTSVSLGSKAADGSMSPPQKGLMSLILAKQGGQWLIEVFHEQDLPTTPPSGSK